MQTEVRCGVVVVCGRHVCMTWWVDGVGLSGLPYDGYYYVDSPGLSGEALRLFLLLFLIRNVDELAVSVN